MLPIEFSTCLEFVCLFEDSSTLTMQPTSLPLSGHQVEEPDPGPEPGPGPKRFTNLS